MEPCTFYHKCFIWQWCYLNTAEGASLVLLKSIMRMCRDWHEFSVMVITSLPKSSVKFIGTFFFSCNRYTKFNISISVPANVLIHSSFVHFHYRWQQHCEQNIEYSEYFKLKKFFGTWGKMYNCTAVAWLQTWCQISRIPGCTSVGMTTVCVPPVITWRPL